MTDSLSHETINAWADDAQGPVALHLKQKLLPVEGEGGVIFPADLRGYWLQHRHAFRWNEGRSD